MGPLIESLAGTSEDLVEACCQALGRMGAREALKPLLRLLGEERTQRVIVAASDSVSRLGSFEAALEILPRMHAASPLLARQLSVAMGNLLGRPGEFYPIVTGDSAERSMALERLQQEAARTLMKLAGGPSSKPGSREALREAMGRGCRNLKEAAAAGDHAAVIQHVYAVLLELCRSYAGQEVVEDEALGIAFMHSPRLGLGLWFATEVRARLEELQKSGLLEIDALLGLYFLSSYREEETETDAG